MESVGQREAFIWFTESQRGLVIRNGVVPEWFHGIISRKMAEELLMSRPPGYFLIRVSESRIGYTLSYRAEDRCRHFMITALEDGHYIILGENRCHRSLQDLVDFHRRTPIMSYTEVLTIPCGQSSNDRTDYAELLFPLRHPNPNTSWIPNNTSQPTLQEDIPPALPYRPNKLRSPAVPSPNRLYPSLNEDYPHVTSPLPASPVPRKRNIVGNPPSNQRPEVPARSILPPLKQNQACVRTVSAPDSPPAPTASEHPLSANDTQSARNQEAKPSVVSNLKNLKKKFQKKRSASQEYMYAEATENEYQEIAGEQISSAPPLSFTYSVLRLPGGELPQEYLPPPPFAPGH